MTNPPLPTAAEALAEAVAIAKSMTNGVSSVERAHLWVAIARELRAGTVRPMRAASLLPGQLVPASPEFHPPKGVAVDMPAPAHPAYVGETAWARAGRLAGERPHDHFTMVDNADVTQVVERLKEAAVTAWTDPSATRHDLTFEDENAAARAARLLRESAPEMQWPDPSAAETQVVSDPGKTQVIWAIGDKAQCRHCLTPIELCEAAIEPNAFVPDGGTAHMWRHKYTGQATCLAATMSSDAADVSHTFAEPAPRG